MVLMAKELDNQYSAEGTEQLVQSSLKGAFKGSPTSFKAVPREARVSRSKPASPKRRKSA